MRPSMVNLLHNVAEKRTPRLLDGSNHHRRGAFGTAVFSLMFWILGIPI